MPPVVSAIVLTYRSPGDTLACVGALLRQTVADRMEIIVVDNHSETDSIGILRNRLPADSRIRLAETPRNLGYGRGNMAGVRLARGEYVLIVNPDTVLPPDALERMTARMEADPTIGVLAPKLVYEDGTVRDSFRAFPSFADIFIRRVLLTRVFRGRPSEETPVAVPQAPTDVDWVAGACLLLRRSLFQELGGFDPRFFLFFEDTDLCRRIWRKGLRVVYDPTVAALDGRVRLSAGGFWSVLTKPTVRSHIASAVRYFWKWRGT